VFSDHSFLAQSALTVVVATMEVCTTALQAWKEVDLDSKRHIWENQCLEIKEHKNSSVVTRKHLNESTKSFRSELASTGGKSVPVEAFMELLKSYQEEIDRLSKRAKYGEGCFVELVKVISAPMDPVSAISTLLKMNASDNTLIAEQSLELERLQNVSVFGGSLSPRTSVCITTQCYTCVCRSCKSMTPSSRL
jgi:hypothetical protein